MQPSFEVRGLAVVLLALSACRSAPPLSSAGASSPLDVRDTDVRDARSAEARAATPMEGDADPVAAEVAERVLARLGGRAAWDRARYVSWVFFGGRRHLWDKWTGDVRIDDSERELTISMNLHTRAGGVRVAGREVEDPALAAEWLDKGYRWWINDSYWMFMPYKLRDPGVHLRSLGDGVLSADGRPAHVLELTFEGVGVTPENRYVVFVADDTDLVEQWDYFATAADHEPKFARPWTGWTPHAGSFGEIWLPHGGEGDDDWSVTVHEEIDDGVFGR